MFRALTCPSSGGKIINIIIIILILLMNKENCALKMIDEIILYYDARSKKRQINLKSVHFFGLSYIVVSPCTVQKNIN